MNPGFAFLPNQATFYSISEYLTILILNHQPNNMAHYQDNSITDPLALVEEATFDFTLGDHPEAIRKLKQVISTHPNCFAAWHALTEIHFADRNLEAALDSAQKAFAINRDDVHINTSLSRIWMEKGDKKMAEHFGAQARMLGWKDQLKDEE